MKLDLHKSANMTAVKVPSKFITITLVALDDRMKAVLYFFAAKVFQSYYVAVTFILQICYNRLCNLSFIQMKFFCNKLSLPL